MSYWYSRHPKSLCNADIKSATVGSSITFFWKKLLFYEIWALRLKNNIEAIDLGHGVVVVIYTWKPMDNVVDIGLINGPTSKL